MEYENGPSADLDLDDIEAAIDPRDVASMLPETDIDHGAVAAAVACINGNGTAQTRLAAHVLAIVVARLEVGRDVDNLWRLAGLLLGLPTMDESDVEARAADEVHAAKVAAAAKIERLRKDHAEALRAIVPERVEAAKRSRMGGDGD